MQYFGEPEGRAKIQMMSKHLQRYYALKYLITFSFPQNSDLSRLLISGVVGGMRRLVPRETVNFVSRGNACYRYLF